VGISNYILMPRVHFTCSPRPALLRQSSPPKGTRYSFGACRSFAPPALSTPRAHTPPLRSSSRNPADEKTALAVSKASAAAGGAGSVAAASTLDGVKAASVVLLTFPSELAATVDSIRALAASLGDVSGKVIVDVTNPLVKGALGELHYAGQSSGGEEFAKALPTAHVFKAFNTVCAATHQ
jgi:hypothetical protein